MGKDVAMVSGNAFTYVLTAVQTNEVFQMIELVLAILTSVIIIFYKIWHWYKEAKADGKITADEIGKGIDIIGDGVADIKDKLEDSKGDEEDAED